MAAIVVAAAALLAGACPASAAPRVVAVESAFSTIAVYGQTVVWSSERPDGRFVLRAYEAGIVRTLPVRSRKVDFDVDLGPDRNGKTVAVYSRCGADGGDVNERCDLFRYRLGGREKRVKGVSRRGYSEHDPSIWRSRIAFARYHDPVMYDDGVFDRIYLSAHGRMRKLPRGGLRSDHEPLYTAQAVRA